MKTVSDKIREAVADWIGGSDTEFSTRDIMDALDIPGIVGRNPVKADSSLVSSAMRLWADGGRIVNGYRAEILTEHGKNRRYRLHAVSRNSKPKFDSEKPKPEPVMPTAKSLQDTVNRIQKAIAGNDLTVKISSVKGDGSMLVQTQDGKLYTMKPLVW